MEDGRRISRRLRERANAGHICGFWFDIDLGLMYGCRWKTQNWPQKHRLCSKIDCTKKELKAPRKLMSRREGHEVMVVMFRG